MGSRGIPHPSSLHSTGKEGGYAEGAYASAGASDSAASSLQVKGLVNPLIYNNNLPSRG